MDFLLEVMKIAGYIGGGFLIAARVAKYYIERDRDLKSENAEMKKSINQLTEQIEELNKMLKTYNVLEFRVAQLEKKVP